MNKIVDFFKGESAEMSGRADKLYSALTHLRYEGRMLREKNLKATLDAVKLLNATLERHRKIQEKVVFPFLRTHVPKHELTIHCLETEHEDILNSEERLKRDIRKFSKVREGVNDRKIYEGGIYLLSLLKHHIGFEVRSIHQSIRHELRDDEREFISNRIAKWIKNDRRRIR